MSTTRHPRVECDLCAKSRRVEKVINGTTELRDNVIAWPPARPRSGGGGARGVEHVGWKACPGRFIVEPEHPVGLILQHVLRELGGQRCQLTNDGRVAPALVGRDTRTLTHKVKMHAFSDVGPSLVSVCISGNG